MVNNTRVVDGYQNIEDAKKKLNAMGAGSMICEVDEVDDLEVSHRLDTTSFIDKREIGPKLIFVKPADYRPVDVEPVFLPLGSHQVRASGHRLIRVRPAPGAECEGDVYDETSF